MNRPSLNTAFATALRSELIATVTTPPPVKSNTSRNLIGAAVVLLAVAVAIPLGVRMGGTQVDGVKPSPGVTRTPDASHTPETIHNSGMSRARIYNSVTELAADSSLVVKATASSSRKDSLGWAVTDVISLEVTTCFRVGGIVGTDPASRLQGPDSCNAGDVVEVRTFRDSGIQLVEGDTYLLFLTSTGLSQDPSNLYYVTGAEAGAYKQVRSGTYQRLVTSVTDVPDVIPLQLNDIDVE